MHLHKFSFWALLSRTAIHVIVDVFVAIFFHPLLIKHLLIRYYFHYIKKPPFGGSLFYSISFSLSIIMFRTAQNWSGCSLSMTGVTLGILCVAMLSPKNLSYNFFNQRCLSALRLCRFFGQLFVFLCRSCARCRLFLGII